MRKRIRGDMIFQFCLIAFVIFTARHSLSGEYQSIRLEPEAKTISAVFDSSGNNTFYAGTLSGILKNVDSRINLSPKNNGLTNAGILALVIDPVNTNVLHCGTRKGAFKSTDGGLNWVSSGKVLKNTEILTLAVDPVKTSTLYAGTRHGVLKSIDGGDNWIPMNNCLSEVAVLAIVIDPADTNTLYAIAKDAAWVVGIFKNYKNEIRYESKFRDYAFKSTNGGKKWSSINVGVEKYNLELESLAVDPIEPNTLTGAIIGLNTNLNWANSKLTL